MTKKVISLEEYNELEEHPQMEMLHKDGVFVGKINVEGKSVILFQLYTFYVELHYMKYRKQINKIITTDNPEILKAYLNQVQVRDLDKNMDENL